MSIEEKAMKFDLLVEWIKSTYNEEEDYAEGDIWEFLDDALSIGPSGEPSNSFHKPEPNYPPFLSPEYYDLYDKIKERY